MCFTKRTSSPPLDLGDMATDSKGDSIISCRRQVGLSVRVAGRNLHLQRSHASECQLGGGSCLPALLVWLLAPIGASGWLLD